MLKIILKHFLSTFDSKSFNQSVDLFTESKALR